MRKKNVIHAAAFAAAVAASGTITRGGPLLTTLVNFNGLGNGSQPFAGLVADSAGNLYGTTTQANFGNGIANGTVYELPVTNYTAITTLATFNNSNGSRPQGALAIDSAGDLFGTTGQGGSALVGTLFAVNVGSGKITDLTSFSSTDGDNPDGGLTLGSGGILYGTTSAGGGNGGGTVFHIPDSGAAAETVQVRFPGGSEPIGRLVVNSAGDIFGTTSGTGTGASGTVFEILPNATTPTTLVAFNGSNGSVPNDLAMDAAGNLYGTTKTGGLFTYGTVFEIPASNPNTIDTLANFNGSSGGNPTSGVLIDSAGDLFGTTTFGGSSDFFGSPSGNGTVYEIVAGSGTVTNLAAFNGSNGATPRAALYADSAGNLYGTTNGGGNNSDGTVFEITSSGFVVGSSPLIIPSGQTHHFLAATSGIVQTKIPGLIIESTGVGIADAAVNSSNRQLLVITGIGLSIAGATNAWTGKLDLTNNDMDISPGSLETITNQLRQGFNNGNWNGSGGISSSTAAADTRHLTALGVIQNNQGGSPIYSAAKTFDGYTPGAADILVKYTYYGDANLDGKVDGSDYTRIDNGFLTQSTGWFNGDFNYDGVVNGSDYTLIDNAFNSQGASLASQLANPNSTVTTQLAAVPEPAMIGVFGVAGMWGLRRRRR